ncbi:MAG: thioesterase domain-containing protein [Ktedonobacteraceae bacterium]
MVRQTVTSPWFRYYKIKPEAHLRLFCFPHAGGGASQFCLWGEKFPAFVEVCPVQLPGREERLGEQPFTQLSALLPPLMEAISGYLDKPFAFFGHSMGALISFELARSLRRCNLPLPQHLFVSAHRAPHLPRQHRYAHVLPSAEFLKAVERLAGTPVELLNNAEAMETFLPVLRADFRLCETYNYTVEEPLSSTLSACGGMMDDSVSRQELDAWRLQTTSAFNLHMFPGAHFYFQNMETPLIRFISYKLK